MKRQLSIHATFSALVARRPDAIALVDDDQTMTYGELARRSDAIAQYLRREGVAHGDRVGIYSQRSIEAVGAMLGILKAGAVYVPFDPSYPAKLLEFVYRDCAPSVLLVQASLAGTATPFWSGAVHDLRTAFDAPAATMAELLPEGSPDDAAYIMYTSGSTGHPKGVLVPHRGVVRLVIDTTFADLGPDRVHLQLAPLAFDASTFEIWGALLNGAKLAILPAAFPSLDEIAAALARHRVTTLWLTAGLFHVMVDQRLEGLRPLTQLLAGGDVLSPTHVAKAQRALPHCQFINGYGPTENTTFTCCYRIPAPTLGVATLGVATPGVATPGAIPIGTPIAHTTVEILEDGQRVADGAAGELFTGGAGVALGYWNRPELTAERFVPDPFDVSGRATLYRTGDRVRRRPDGNLEFLGRVDRQVKINGKRVELDEIEARLRGSGLVADAAVTSPVVQTGSRKVHAYVRFGEGQGSLEELRAFLKQELPDYMFPATFTVLAVLPLSPTGKVDRSKLPPPADTVNRAPATNTSGAVPGAPPGASAMEALLADIWCEVLGLPAVGVNDNFFDLGGTSLQVIAVHAKIVASMPSDITVVDLFQFPRISALAARLGPHTAAPAGALGAASGGLSAGERARRQQAALARARSGARRTVP